MHAEFKHEHSDIQGSIEFSGMDVDLEKEDKSRVRLTATEIETRVAAKLEDGERVAQLIDAIMREVCFEALKGA